MDEKTRFDAVVAALRESRGLAAKRDIALATQALAGAAPAGSPVGDDCAAIPDGDGYLLLAIEGFINEFVAADPWFAGWCAVMVNLSDVAAMGGRPAAIVDAVWADGAEGASPILQGMLAASKAYGVPVAGGHTSLRCDRRQLSAAVLGRAKALLTSFDAVPGDVLIAAIDHRGRYREPFSNWEAATTAPPQRLRGDLELLPHIAESGLARAAKDISQGGIVGTAAMLAECSGVGIDIDLARIVPPPNVPLDRWLQTFPSFGYLIAAKPAAAAEILALFAAREIRADIVGDVVPGRFLRVVEDGRAAVIWDFSRDALIGCGPGQAAA